MGSLIPHFRYEYWVDQPLTVQGHKQPVYPDIALVRGQVLRHIVGVKLDLGWRRDEFPDQCRRTRDEMRRLRGTTSTVRQGKDRRKVRIAHRCGYHLVVVSGKNFPKERLDGYLKKVGRLEPDLYVYVLTDEVHPNDEALRGGSKYPNLKEREFETFLRRLAH